MTAQVIQRDKLGVLTKIGQGGQGVVYSAPNVKTKFAASMVYKEYKRHTVAEIDFTALAAMPALVEDSLSYAQAERLISITAWPCALVEDAGTSTGFVMPAIPEEFFIRLKTVKGESSTTAEFQHLLNHASVLEARGIELDDAQRYALLREVASALAFLHKHGVCVGDISPKNLLVSLRPHEAVYFVDCDAMRINGVSALPQVNTPGWDTPAGEELATIYSDTYKLGLLALRLLVGDQDTKNAQHLRSTTQGLLRQIITDTLTNEPQRRPLPEAWSYVLGQAIEEAQHQQKLATAPTLTPAPVAPNPPLIPQVRCRPSVPAPSPPTAYSKPPVGSPALAQVGEQRLPPAAALDYPPESAPERGRPKRWKRVLIAVIVMLVGAGITGYLYVKPALSVLPFTGLHSPAGVAVDTAGDVFVVDAGNHRVVKLVAGTSTQIMLPFADLKSPWDVAVDTAGDVYVTDGSSYAAPDNQAVVKLAAGSSTPTVLPFSGLKGLSGVAVDTAGDVFVVDAGNHRVLKLENGSSAQIELPFTDLKDPVGVAVDVAGDVYVTDQGNQSVVKLVAASSTQIVLPFTGLYGPWDVAVNAAGDVYVVDHGHDRIVKLASGSSNQTEMRLNPFNVAVSGGNLKDPNSVAVDTVGNVYVTEDYGNDRVVKVAG
jgi:serine/threonine protein kinase/sugar lactone lactonase YvrE